MKHFIYFLIPAFLFVACGPQERISKNVFDEVNNAMEAKKLSEAQITQEAMIWGDSISTKAQQELMASLHKAVEEKGFDGALDFCNVNAAPIVKKLSDNYGVTIRRTSYRARNQNNLPTEDESPILDAYQYNVENGIESEPNIQKIEGGEVLLYTKAIVISSEFCLACHGDPGNDIDKGILYKIDSLYPNDSARDFEVGNLRGMWSLKIPKKAVVNRL
ncbi:DUF3365 domain-containing protein [Algoriphagus sp. D3-2-R+10]|uniref:Tll0287-like domain-containing protein n=1 Tax=Algoriphagus aurantiacus TaxID=3103948 RepID=UPI002B373795|nr:DUF3365 domain-containing protein [Algoriphagus sp. D3-2-R+10]MEB2774738.1 DUF3365 domain-containing protein [Algoriphagus sp. D3-2-R+10]